MHMLRKTVSIGLVFSVLLGVFAFSGCSKKDKGGVKKVSKDTPWFDSTTVEIGGQYKDMNLFFLQEEMLSCCHLFCLGLRLSETGHSFIKTASSR